MAENWRNIPVPDRMKNLPRDHRGYPIFWMAFRDKDGRAHFTVNDEGKRLRLMRRDGCSICGGKLLRGRWFIGGEKSAFDPAGCYLDPPMHAECARYALRVCPYLAAPTYASLIHGATVPADDPTTLIDQTRVISPSTADEVRPVLFVAVLARGQKVYRSHDSFVIAPTRPYIAIEYWQHGVKLTERDGAAIVRQTGLAVPA